MSKKKLIICGTGTTADVLFYFFENHSDYQTVAFTVDKNYITADLYNGLPVVPFEEIESKYDSSSHVMFVAIGYSSLNKLRAEKIVEAKSKGYELISYIHPDSGVTNDFKYGENCFVMNNVHIHPHVKIGDNVFVWSGTILCHHSTVGNDCWFTSGVNVAGNATIGSNCFFAVNSTVTNDVTVGDRCFIGANALVSSDLEDDKVVIVAGTKVYPLSSEQFLDFKKNKF